MRPHYFDLEKYRPRGPYDQCSPCAQLVELLRAGAALLREWRKRARGRRELAQLDSKTLRDIGATPAEVVRECGKPFWRA